MQPPFCVSIKLLKRGCGLAFYKLAPCLKGYSSGQSHFSEIYAKLAEENEFVTHFVQKCVETRENEQNVVLNESLEALGNCSDFGTCHDNS